MYRIEHLIDAMRLARIDSDIDSGERLTGREYLETRGISLALVGGLRYTPACQTDVRATWRRWCAETGHPLPDWLRDPVGEAPVAAADLPPALRRQAD